VLRERLDVRPAPGLAGLGPHSLPSTTLGMVIANLAQNAAEAAQQAGRARVALRIDGRITTGSAGPQLELSVSDDGPGVDPALLPQLFQKGFSTKSQATNSGLGLHWCANTLRAMGGSINVHTNGAGGGLRFEMDIPLVAPAAGNEEQAA
jgi:signal transduction histidine kinase